MELREFTKKKKFSGIDITTEGFIVVFDGKNYKITEDEDDGYRSYLNNVEEVQTKVTNTFDEVEVCCVYKDDGYYDIVEVYDSINSKLILTFGTENCDDYYPYCVMDWNPENMSVNE